MTIKKHKDNDEQQKIILYVDDEKISCRYFERICNGYFAVKTAFSGEEALEFLNQNSDQVKLIVTDQRMPKMQGTELLAQVRDLYPHITKIITTAFMTESDALILMQKYDVVECLYKPWDIHSLLSVLEKTIADSN